MFCWQHLSTYSSLDFHVLMKGFFFFGIVKVIEKQANGNYILICKFCPINKENVCKRFADTIDDCFDIRKYDADII